MVILILSLVANLPWIIASHKYDGYMVESEYGQCRDKNCLLHKLLNFPRKHDYGMLNDDMSPKKQNLVKNYSPFVNLLSKYLRRSLNSNKNYSICTFIYLTERFTQCTSEEMVDFNSVFCS
jgi:hypothetical protein